MCKRSSSLHEHAYRGPRPYLTREQTVSTVACHHHSRHMPHAGWFAEDMRLSFDHTYDAVALAGMLTSATIVIARSPLIYLMTAQWGFYLSMYLVGQTFLSFQWDILLSVYSRKAFL